VAGKQSVSDVVGGSAVVIAVKLASGAAGDAMVGGSGAALGSMKFGFAVGATGGGDGGSTFLLSGAGDGLRGGAWGSAPTTG
jgi:hypothetical protein